MFFREIYINNQHMLKNALIFIKKVKNLWSPIPCLRRLGASRPPSFGHLLFYSLKIITTVSSFIL